MKANTQSFSLSLIPTSRLMHLAFFQDVQATASVWARHPKTNGTCTTVGPKKRDGVRDQRSNSSSLMSNFCCSMAFREWLTFALLQACGRRC